MSSSKAGLIWILAMPTVPPMASSPADRVFSAMTPSSNCSISASDGDVFEGRDRKADEAKWNGTRVDLVSGLNPELRTLAEV